MNCALGYPQRIRYLLCAESFVQQGQYFPSLGLLGYLPACGYVQPKQE